MKKTILLAVLLLSLTGCNNGETYSLKEASGFEISNIESIIVSASVYQSAAWAISEDAISYLEIKYIKTDFNIDEEFMAWPPSTAKDDAYVLHIETDIVYSLDVYPPVTSNYYTTFFISHSSRYMYFLGIDSCYRSLSKMPERFILLINQWN
ncbi:MAG: lipoprotein [Bacilli bacterium]|jgi:hypothetical protein